MQNIEKFHQKYGDFLYYQAMSIPEWYLNKKDVRMNANGTRTISFVFDSYYSGEFNIAVNLDENLDFVDGTCNCDVFAKKHFCQHLLACLIKKQDDFLTSEEISIKMAHRILNEFIDNGSGIKNKAKEELGVDVELLYSEGSFLVRLKIGTSNKYVIKSKEKFNGLKNAYFNNTDFAFGKKFTYNPSNYFFNEDNTKLMEFLFNYSSENINSYDYIDEPLKLNSREFAELLMLLQNKTFLLNDVKINKIVKGFPTGYELTYQENKYEFSITNLDKFTFVDDRCHYVIYNNVLYVLKNSDSRIVRQLQQNHITSLVFAKEDLELFKKGLLEKTMNTITVSETVKDVKIIKEKKANIYFDLNDDEIIAKVILKYGDTEFNYFDEVKDIVRDSVFENKVIDDLLIYGFVENKKKFVILDADLAYNFLENDLNYFTDNYTVFTTEKIKKIHFLRDTKIKSNFSIGKDNILSYNFDIDNVSSKEVASLLGAVKNKKKYYRLKSGDVISLLNNQELEDFANLTADLNLDSKKLESENIEIPKYRAFFIESLKNNRYSKIITNNKFDEFIKNFKTYKNAQIEFSCDEQELLRDYQKEGIKWLYTIYKCDLGGILADEMGLGKTLQTIIFLRKVIAEKPDAKILIVSPTSLVYNWEKEFIKFAPDLKYVVVAENKKKRQEIMQKFADYNIFITTYGLIRNDNDEYENKDFEVCVIDEAQAIKNYQAGMTKEIKKIKARTKIALTGTPLENSIYELWSIFDFIMPGYLNSIVRFREIYGIKDVDEESLKKLDNLNYQIKPFILRRKKKEVSKELPDKIEHIEYLEMSDTEKALYQGLVTDTKEAIDEIVAREGFIKARFKIVTLLMRLRQLCVSPALIDNTYQGESIKIKRLLEIIKDLVKDKHKILIFSSFKSAIELVKEELAKESISNYVIDGSVSGRQRVMLVDAFNKDETSCFLITLKSGGVGLNLTSADVVIHLDVWWNPQAENQATDRAHRIGQTKTVTVLKLINKGTIEEKIIELQEKKKILSDSLIEGNGCLDFDTLTEEELTNLLSIGYNIDNN